jgi:hypothetical protein
MRDALVTTVTDLSLSLRPGEIGQLLVTYSGHGRGGILCGVDGPATGQVPPEWLMERARAAAMLGVQITYVLDTCHAGRLAQLAQRMAAERMQASLDSLPPGRRAAIQPLLTFRAAVADATEAMSDRTIDIILAQRALQHGRRPDGTSRSNGIPIRDELRLAVIESVQALAGANDRLLRSLRGKPVNSPDSDQLSAAADRLAWRLLPAFSGEERAIEAAFRQEAVALDLAADYMTQLLALIRNEATSAPRSRAA